MKSSRFYKIIIVLLVALNVATLGFMWFGRPPLSHPPGKGPLLSEILQLEGEEKSTVNALEKRHHKEKHQLMEKDAELHQKMFELIGTDSDPSEIQKKLDANKSKIERMTFQFFNEIANNCSDAQEEELKKFIHHAMSRVRHNPPPRK